MNWLIRLLQRKLNCFAVTINKEKTFYMREGDILELYSDNETKIRFVYPESQEKTARVALELIIFDKELNDWRYVKMKGEE